MYFLISDLLCNIVSIIKGYCKYFLLSFLFILYVNFSFCIFILYNTILLHIFPVPQLYRLFSFALLLLK